MKVIFKETYMPHPVERNCFNATREQAIDFYKLNDPDIEWYRFVEEDGQFKQ